MTGTRSGAVEGRRSPALASHRVGTIIALLLLAGLVVSACSRGAADASGAEGVDASLAITPDPPEVGSATIEVTLTGEDDAAVTGAEVEVVGDMSHAGMQPVQSATEEVEPGRYRTTEFEFTMAGDWIITISGTLADGDTFKRTIEVDGVSQ